jgi:glycosyltransferase involved in cell wall biosynthesis
MIENLRVALVHDLLLSYGGSEQVILELHRMFPEAPIYTTIYDPTRLPERFGRLPVRSSSLKRVPLLRRYYAAMVPLMPRAFERFDLGEVDLVISSSHAFAKAVNVPRGALHVCYCHTPLRYAWSHQEEYLASMPMRTLLKPAARFTLERLRRRDYATSQRVDTYIANSKNVQQRIRDYYGRPADVVNPPVDLERFAVTPPASPDAPFLVVGRLFAYKRIDAAVRACTSLGLPLRVVGRGPELRRLRSLAGPSVQFLGEVDDAELQRQYRECRALLFTADEDFGIVPLEAMATGRPVLALNAGGARETVVAGSTGEFYGNSGVNGLIQALRAFEPDRYDPAACRQRAEEFSAEAFRAGVNAVLERDLGRTPNDVLAVKP